MKTGANKIKNDALLSFIVLPAGAWEERFLTTVESFKSTNGFIALSDMTITTLLHPLEDKLQRRFLDSNGFGFPLRSCLRLIAELSVISEVACLSFQSLQLNPLRLQLLP